MKKLVMAVSAVALLGIGSSAFAIEAPGSSTSVTLSGSVANQCGVGNQTGGGVRTPGSASVTLPSMVDANGFLSIANQDIAFDNVWCNSPSTLTMVVTPLTTTTPNPDASSFVTSVKVTVGNDATHKVLQTYFGLTAADTLTSDAGTLSHSLTGGFETGTNQFSKAVLSFSLPTGTSGNDRPVAGAYSGSVTITATPAA